MTEDIVRLAARNRTEFGKGAARRARAAGLVPAVLYGHGTETHHLSLPALEFTRAVKGDANRVLALDVDGKELLALPRAVVRHPIKDYLQHVDLLIVRRGEKVTVDVPAHLVGDAAPGTLVLQETVMLSIEVDALAIPENIEVSIEGAEAGAIIHAGAITLPTGATLVTDAETVIVAVQASSAGGAEEESAAEESAAAGEA